MSFPSQLPLRYLFEQLYHKADEKDKLSVMGVSDNSQLNYMRHMKEKELTRLDMLIQGLAQFPRSIEEDAVSHAFVVLCLTVPSLVIGIVVGSPSIGCCSCSSDLGGVSLQCMPHTL